MNIQRSSESAPSRNPRGHAIKRVAPPLLVTGVPRSGTTWLGRALAGAYRTSLIGREPMNPGRNGYALGGTLNSWTRLMTPGHRQIRLLQSTYAGTNPMTYGRYGERQWAAALPTSRIIVKDPFAMLSLPAITNLTNATPVLIYRHPGAVLASYRRMGWTADMGDIGYLYSLAKETEEPMSEPSLAEAKNMGLFWSLLNRQALADMESIQGALVVSHEELSLGGYEAMLRFFEVCHLEEGQSPAVVGLPAEESVVRESSSVLHNFNRCPDEVARGWKSHITNEEFDVLDAVAGDTLAKLESRRLEFTKA